MAPGEGRVDARRQDHVDLGWEQFDEPTEVGDQRGIGEVMEIIEDDDRFGQLVQLRAQRLEE